MSATPRVDAADLLGLDDDAMIRITLAELAADDAERATAERSRSLDDLIGQYDTAVLAVHEGDSTMVAEVERLEGEIAQRELEQRRAAAARRAEVARVARLERERMERERAEAVAKQVEARQQLDLLQPELERTAREFAKAAGRVMAIGVESANGSGANQSSHVAAVLKTALFDAVDGRPKEWLLSELGGRPSARERGLA